MPGALYHVEVSAMCPHGGRVAPVPFNVRVLVNGRPVVTIGDDSPIVGCAAGPTGISPCTRVEWTTAATRVMVGGQPALLQTSAGLCIGGDGAPRGPVLISWTQSRVIAA